MKKLTMFFKSLLIAAGLLMGGVNCTWAENMTTMTGLLGLSDNSNGFGAYASKSVTIAAGESYVYTFANYNKGDEGTDVWENWVVEGRRSDNSQCFDFRADGGYWEWHGDMEQMLTPSYVGNTSTDVSSTATDWLSAYNGVTVTLTISRSNDGNTITVAHSATTNTSVSYTGTFTCSGFGTGAATIILTNEDSHQIIQKVVYTYDGGGKVYTSRMTYISGTEANKGTSYGEVVTATTGYNKISGGSVELANSGWGVNNIVYVQVDASDVPTSDATIISATLDMNATGNGRDHYIGVGYNSAVWSPTMTWNTATRTITKLGDTQKAANGKTAALSFDILSAITAGTATSLLIYDTAAGGSPLTNVEGTITYTTATVYTATFTETNNLNPTITVYTDEDMTVEEAKNNLSDGTTYYYKATLTGYNDYTGSFTVSGADPSVEFTMTPKATFTYTKRAVCGSDVLNATLATGSAYEGETVTLSWSKYIKVSEQWYVATANTFQSSATAATTEDVEYTPSDIAYFYEMESGLSRSGGAALTDNMNIASTLSGATALRLSKNSLYYTPALAGGVYTLSIPWRNTNGSSSEVYVYTRASNGDLSEKLTTFTATGSGNGTFTYVITVPDGYSIAFNGNEGSSANNNARMDYMTLTPYKVSGTIASSGWSSLATAYGLDFTEATGLSNAFVVTSISKDAVTLTSVDEISANSGVILKGEGSAAYNIPVKAGATYSGTNKLQAAVTATDVEANEAYILQGGLFHLVTEASTVPAGKAYLLASDVPAAARSLSFIFDEETTGIAPVSTDRLNGEFYNLQGQRINNPKQGLYIVNGKKVIIK